MRCAVGRPFGIALGELLCLVQTNSGHVTQVAEVCSSRHLHRDSQVFIVRNHLGQEVKDRLQLTCQHLNSLHNSTLKCQNPRTLGTVLS